VQRARKVVHCTKPKVKLERETARSCSVEFESRRGGRKLASVVSQRKVRLKLGKGELHSMTSNQQLTIAGPLAESEKQDEVRKKNNKEEYEQEH